MSGVGCLTIALVIASNASCFVAESISRNSRVVISTAFGLSSVSAQIETAVRESIESLASCSSKAFTDLLIGGAPLCIGCVARTDYPEVWLEAIVSKPVFSIEFVVVELGTYSSLFPLENQAFPSVNYFVGNFLRILVEFQPWKEKGLKIANRCSRTSPWRSAWRTYQPS